MASFTGETIQPRPWVSSKSTQRQLGHRRVALGPPANRRRDCLASTYAEPCRRGRRRAAGRARCRPRARPYPARFHPRRVQAHLPGRGANCRRSTTSRHSGSSGSGRAGTRTVDAWFTAQDAGIAGRRGPHRARHDRTAKSVISPGSTSHPIGGPGNWQLAVLLSHRPPASLRVRRS